MDGVTTGVVKRVKRAEGFGFAICADGQERFFHRSGFSKPGEFDRLVENSTKVKGTIAPGKPGKDERLEGVFII